MVPFDPEAPPNTDAWDWFLDGRPSGAVALDSLLCPSDGVGRSTFASRTGMWHGSGFSNYRACRGDLAGTDCDRDTRGFYFLLVADIQYNMPRSWARTFKHVGDFGIVTSGLSNTIAFSEQLIGRGRDRGETYKDAIADGILAHYSEVPQNCLNLKGGGGRFKDENQAIFGGAHRPWMGRRIWNSVTDQYVFYSLLPPNSPSCTSYNMDRVWMSATSNHRGGVNVSFLDGSVRFITDSIETKNLTRSVRSQFPIDQPPAFPIDDDDNPFSYGIWAELGAVNSREAPSL